MTENEAIEIHIAENIHRIEVIEDFMHSNSDADKETCSKNISVLTKINGLLREIQQYRAIGTIEEFKALKEKSNKDFELLLKAVKESYPMFKGAYVELDLFMGDVMRRFTRERK